MVDFEDYLRVKKIDSAAFSQAEPLLWRTWKSEFEKMHPNSFTVQKLNLINAIRRKYLLSDTTEPKSAETATPGEKQAHRPGAPRPVMKPKPKMDQN